MASSGIASDYQVGAMKKYEFVCRNHKLIVAQLFHIATSVLVNIGSCNGLLPDDTIPLPELRCVCMH